MSSAMMCIAKIGGLRGRPAFFASYRQVQRHSLYWVGLSEVREDRIPFMSGIVRSWIQIGRCVADTTRQQLP